MTQPTDIAYKKPSAVLAAHGLLPFAGSWLFRGLAWVTPTRLVFQLLESGAFERSTLRSDDKRVKPLVQDFVAIGVLAISLWLAWPSEVLASRFQQYTACWLLADIVVYLAPALWFDDLRTGREWYRLRVFSHRRMLFHAILGFVQSIVLFGLLYSAACGTEAGAYRASFTTATSLSPPDRIVGCAPALTILQVCFSLFFFIAALSVLAAVGYRRVERAPNDGGAPYQ